MAGADPAVAEAAVEELPPPLPRENAVLVFGGTGKLGRRIVEKVGDGNSSHKVTSCCRNGIRFDQHRQCAGSTMAAHQVSLMHCHGLGSFSDTAVAILDIAIQPCTTAPGHSRPFSCGHPGVHA
jgi:hypothetical protein